ncbi:MAG: hypothetical protein FWD23_16570 [Oscillospiraceae bacterium]|nr:hypothetical protein [Oscillospiraceae bacterium]
MNRIYLKLKNNLRNEKGEIVIYTCFFILGVIMIISFLLLYASVQINVINIRNGAKMELNNLAASIYADTFHSQREANFTGYMSALNSGDANMQRFEQAVRDGLASKVPLETDDYRIRNIRLEFNRTGNRIEYAFTCEVQFFITMFGNRYPAITRNIRLTGYHNTKF